MHDASTQRSFLGPRAEVARVPSLRGVQCTDGVVLLVVLMSQSNRVEFFLIFPTYDLLIGLSYVVLYFLCYMNATHIILCGCKKNATCTEKRVNT
jgi:hypothetical protein